MCGIPVVGGRVCQSFVCIRFHQQSVDTIKTACLQVLFLANASSVVTGCSVSREFELITVRYDYASI